MEVDRQIIEAMIAHALFAHPREACGLLASDGGGRMRMVYCLTNTRHSLSRFSLDPTEHYRAMGHAESLGWEISGVFHSHPTSAPYPSATDVSAGLDPAWLNVIVSLGDAPEVRAFWIRDGNVDEEPLILVGKERTSFS